MKTGKVTKVATNFIVFALVFALLCTCGVTTVFANLLAYDSEYYADYSTWEEVEAAAADLNIEIAAEGMALLKNEGNVLPFDGNVKKISLFGVRSDNALMSGSGTGTISGSSSTLIGSIQAAGYTLNPALVRFYANDASTAELPITDYTRAVTESYALYGDAAIIIFSRTGGENADLSTSTTEAADAGEHISGITKKHYLEFTANEEALMKHVAANFDKVVLLLNSSNPMELKEINQAEYGIDAAIWIGHTGQNGIEAIGKILSGEVNPSGKLVDFFETDFTSSPVWNNYGTGSQAITNTGVAVDATTNPYPNLYRTEDGEIYGTVPNGNTPGSGFTEVQYEEGIYMGYKFYETMAYEMNRKTAGSGDDWYEENAMYPFGYGLSYTTFTQDILGIYTDEACTSAKEISGAFDGDEKVLYVKVQVTNTGDVAGKDVVQIYNTAPYISGEVEKSYVQLVGFEKSSIIAPSKSEIVVVAVNVQDMASFDYNDANKNGSKTYELDEGTYYLKAQKNSHEVYDSYTLVLDPEGTADAVILDKDDYSGNTVEALFSVTDTESYYFDYNTLDYVDVDGTATLKMTLISRTQFYDGSYKQPEAATVDELKRSDEWFAAAKARDTYSSADDTTDGSAGGGYIGQPWASFTLPSTWTQGTGTADSDGHYAILFCDMVGIDMYDTTNTITSSNAAINGLTGEKAWEKFMNQLTWAELLSFIGNGTYHTAAIPSVDKDMTYGTDGPVQLRNIGAFGWAAEPLQAGTFNKDLIYQQGLIIGNEGLIGSDLYPCGCRDWYGPGMNTHRSHFLGRTFEYYSEDGILAGYMAASCVGGATSKGMNCYIKHFALNEQEVYRKGISTFCTEQAFREIYLKPFQMAMQEGNSFAMMTSFNRIGNIAAAVNYVLIQELVRDEWGFDGAIVTDMFNVNCWPTPMLLRAGGDLPLSGNKVYDGVWDATLRSNKGSVKVSSVQEFSANKSYAVGDKVRVTTIVSRVENYNYYTFTTAHPAGAWNAAHVTEITDATQLAALMEQSDEQYYYLRVCAQRALYMAANSSSGNNGLNMNEFEGKALADATQGAAYSKSLAIDTAKLGTEDVSYRITDGKLPEGLTMDSNGTISGTPVGETGTFSFTVVLTADGWVRSDNQVTAARENQVFTIKVTPAFELEAEAAPVAGTEYYGVISSDTIGVDSGFTMTYSLEGTLPAGIVFDASTGEFSGKATVIGTFDLVATITSSKTVVSGRTTTVVKNTYKLPIQLVVTGTAAPTVAEQIAALQAKITTLETSSATFATSATLAALKAEVDTLNGTVDGKAAAAKITEIEAKITAIETDVTALEDAAAEGCGSAIGISTASVLVALIAGAALISRRKKED